MSGPRKLIRLFYIQYVLLKYGLDEVLPDSTKSKLLKILASILPSRLIIKRRFSLGTRIRFALEQLGPIFIKFGQLLSTRLDILPEAVAKELACLQDKVAPFCKDKARQIVELAYGAETTSLFVKFEAEPLASASIAQVHAATLQDGREIVLKIVRPGIEKRINLDISLLLSIAELMEKYWPKTRRLHPIAVILEFKKAIIDELDMVREAANASQLKRNFTKSKELYVPEIHWPLTKKNILAMERIRGFQISDKDEIAKQNISLKKLAEQGVEIFFTQVFRDCFFHADVHPGNIWVKIENGQSTYIALDFGIIGTLGPEDQRYLAENFLAFFNRDYRRVAELHLESGWVPPSTRVDEFESSIRCVCEPIFERPLKDISIGKTLLRLFQTASRFKMEIQPQLILLQKTLLSVEGIGRHLYPELDLWNTAKPFLENWLQRRIGFRGLYNQVQQNYQYWLERLPQIPQMLYESTAKKTAKEPYVPEINPGKSERSFYRPIPLLATLFCLMLILPRGAVSSTNLSWLLLGLSMGLLYRQ